MHFPIVSDFTFPEMKNITSKLYLLVSILVMSFTISAQAADANKQAQHKAEAQHKADLAKYDTNKDGKLDAAEKAAMKADKEKANKK